MTVGIPRDGLGKRRMENRRKTIGEIKRKEAPTMRGICKGIVWTVALLLLIGFVQGDITQAQNKGENTPTISNIPVSNGTSVTIYERTTDWLIYTFDVSTLTTTGATFDTLADEHYTITSDGTYLTINCYRPTTAGGVGHNIAAVRLDGVPGYPDGIYASMIISYTLGMDGDAESRFNALGNDITTHTLLGDLESEIVLGFSTDIDPGTPPNTNVPVSNGTSVTIYERTTDWLIYTFDVSTLTTTGATFDTLADEHYTITSDGTYLTINCYRPTTAGGVGHNIAAVRLDGVPGYPDGIYASMIISYTLGMDGDAESRFNALGGDITTHTCLGDLESEIVLGFSTDTEQQPNQPPVADAGPDRTTETNTEIQFDASGSYDPDGAIASYEWDFGDNSIGTGAVISHAYPDDGTYTATLTVFDDDGASAIDTCVITVLNRAPVPDAGDDKIALVLEEITFDGSCSYDSDGIIISYEWDFGDGSIGTGCVVSYAYSEPGTYTVTLRVVDDDGTSAVDTSMASITEQPTRASLSITKEKINGPDVVETHTCYGWTLEITVINEGGSFATDVYVYDVLPAELELINHTITHGTFAYVQNGHGQMGSTSLTWYVGSLGPQEEALLTLCIATTTNPAGHQEFTSPGTYSLNDGAWATGIDSLTGEVIVAGPTPPITVVAEDDGEEDGCEGDGSGDSLSPMEESNDVDDSARLEPMEEPLGTQGEESKLADTSTKSPGLPYTIDWIQMVGYAVLLISLVTAVSVVLTGRQRRKHGIEEPDSLLIRGDISEDLYYDLKLLRGEISEEEYLSKK
ncbi:MAG: PKD domain-containing protein [Candidatus Thermoplasmatota archaeon]